MHERFTGASIQPGVGTFNTKAKIIGEPGWPCQFIQRDTDYAVVSIVDK